MFRCVLVLVALGLSFELTGLGAALGEPACSADCPDDRSGAECPPNCHTCDCCSGPRVVPAEPTTGVLLSVARAARWAPRTQAPPSVDPSEILHVPKLLA